MHIQNNIQKKELRIYLLIITLAIGLCLFTLIAILNQYRTLQKVKQEERSSALTLLHMIEHSLQTNLYSYQQLQNLQLENADRFLELLSLSNDYQDFDKILGQSDLRYAMVIAENEDILWQSKLAHIADIALIKNAPKSAVPTLITSPEDNTLHMIIFRQHRWYIVGIDQTLLQDITQPVQLSAYFDFLRYTMINPYLKLPQVHITYVIIQDNKGIFAATSNIQKLQRLKDDTFLQKVLNTKVEQSRTLNFDKKPVLEVVTDFQMNNNEEAVLRLGVSLDRVTAYQHQSNIMLIVFCTLLLIIMSLGYIGFRYYKQVHRLQQTVQYQKRMVEIGKLGGEITHEIKNPLNAIYIILQRLKSEFKTEQQEEYEGLLTVSYEEIQRINTIIEKFLSYSRPLQLQYEKIHLVDLLQSIYDLFATTFSQQKILYLCECPPELEIYVDTQLLKQTLINLFKNAIESFLFPQADRTIRIRCYNKHNTCIEIEDNGSPISDLDQQKIWELYFTTKEKGSGLGLAIARKIIESHQGSISLSVRNEFKRFSICLPTTITKPIMERE